MPWRRARGTRVACSRSLGDSETGCVRHRASLRAASLRPPASEARVSPLASRLSRKCPLDPAVRRLRGGWGVREGEAMRLFKRSNYSLLASASSRTLPAALAPLADFVHDMPGGEEAAADTSKRPRPSTTGGGEATSPPEIAGRKDCGRQGARSCVCVSASGAVSSDVRRSSSACRRPGEGRRSRIMLTDA